MSASFFSGAHNFSVGEMNVKNVSGDYIDHSTKNVRNTFRGGNNYYSSYDQSYHDSSNHHHGNNYNTTNHNHGPVNNIERVDNANFGTNYGSIAQNTFDGPQQNSRTDHHHNAPTYNYDTKAPGGSVVNGDFHGTQYNQQGSPHPEPQADRYRPFPGQGPPPPPGGQRVGQSPRSPPYDDRQYGHGPSDGQQRPPPAPAPGDFTASDPAVPQQQYRRQREQQQQSDCPPGPGFNPWQGQNQHQPPPNAPYPNERTATAPGRPQPNAEWREHQSHPASAPPPAFPPAGSQNRDPSPPRPWETLPPSGGAREKSRGSAEKPKRPPSWEGETHLRETLKENGISDSEDSDYSTGKRYEHVDSDSDSERRDGYGVGSGRQSKEKEAATEREARKDKEARKEKEPAGGWNQLPLLQESNMSQSLLAPPSRSALPPFVGTMPLTPTPVPDSLKKPSGSPAPSHKGSFYGQPQRTPSARPLSTPNALSTPAPLPHALAEASPVSKTHKPSASASASASLTNLQSGQTRQNGSDHDDRDVDFQGLHGVLDGGELKKKKKNPVKKFVRGVFGTSRKKTLD